MVACIFHARIARNRTRPDASRLMFAVLALLSLVFPASTTAAFAVDASARSAAGGADYALADIMRDPEAFVGKQVVFLCRFAGPSQLYKPAKTRLGQNEYANFAAWPLQAELWTDAGRQNSLPSLYVAKNNRRVNEALRTLRRYDLVAVTGRVVSPYSGLPWILAGKVERLPGGVDETTVLLMSAGVRALEAGDGATALDNFEHALAGLPDEFRPAAYEYTARAHILAGDNGRAREWLYRVLDAGKDSPEVRLAIADLSLKVSDPRTVLVECATPMPRPDQRIAALGMSAEAKALLGDIESAFELLRFAESAPGATQRDRAVLDLHRARIYAHSGRVDDAAALYAELCRPDAALAGEAWLRRERSAFQEKLGLHIAGGRSVVAAVATIAEPVAFGSSPLSDGRSGSAASALPVDATELVLLADTDLLGDLLYREPGLYSGSGGFAPGYALAAPLSEQSSTFVYADRPAVEPYAFAPLEPPPALSDRDGEAHGLVAYAAFTPRDGYNASAPAIDASGTAAFSFAPDRSPTIVAGYGSDSETAVGMPVRNPNLYRKARDSDRRPAEVSAGKPAPDAGLYLMSGGGGQLHRTRVLLPSTPQGIGQDHELTPLR